MQGVDLSGILKLTHQASYNFNIFKIRASNFGGLCCLPKWTNVDKKGQKSHPDFGRYTWLVSPNKLQEETLPSYVVKSTCFFINSLLLYIASLTGLHSEIVDVSFFPAMLMRIA